MNRASRFFGNIIRFAESIVLFIPTAIYATPDGAAHAWRFISGQEARTPMYELDWKSRVFCTCSRAR